MKLLYITNQICGAAGLERVLSIKASYLADRFDYEVHILTLNQKDKPLFYNFSEKLNYHDIIVNGEFVNAIFQYINGINAVINKIKPDIISVCDDGLKGFFVPLFTKKSCPIIYERHVSINVEQKKDKNNVFSFLVKKIKYSLMKFGAKKFKTFVVLTEGNLKEWNLNNTMVISNPISFFSEESSNLNNKIVLVVGRQSYQKGYDFLLKSWKNVNECHPDWELKIFGLFDENLKLNDLAKELGISNSVSFYEPVKNIEDKYKEASIYVMSSRFEGFGMVLIEAMSYGLPCVSFDCPYGPSDIIIHNKNGLLVENGDVENLAKSINVLIENLDLRKDLGKNAKIHAKNYLPEKIMNQWDSLFKNLLA